MRYGKVGQGGKAAQRSRLPRTSIIPLATVEERQQRTYGAGLLKHFHRQTHRQKRCKRGSLRKSVKIISNKRTQKGEGTRKRNEFKHDLQRQSKSSAKMLGSRYVRAFLFLGCFSLIFFCCCVCVGSLSELASWWCRGASPKVKVMFDGIPRNL